jgi:hypothetical protein
LRTVRYASNTDRIDASQQNVARCQNRKLAESVDRKLGTTSGSFQGVGDLFTARSRQGLIADELVLQLATFLRSLDLFLELRVRTPRTLTANQVRQGGKQDTDGRELSRVHFSACLALTSLLRSLQPKD